MLQTPFSKSVLDELGFRDDAANTWQELSEGTQTGFALLRAINDKLVSSSNGLIYSGTVSANGTTSLVTIEGLAGLPEYSFPANEWYIYFSSTTDGAAPIKEIQPVSTYDYETGQFGSGVVFTAASTLGDYVVIFHHIIYELSLAGAVLTTIDGIVADIQATLGAVDDAAASGAVTDTDTAMAYIKQLVTEGIARDAEIAKIPKSDGTVSWNATALAAIRNSVCLVGDTASSIGKILYDIWNTTLPGIVTKLAKPAKNALTDATPAEALGIKEDDAVTTVGVVASAIAYIKGILNQLAHATYGLSAIKTLIDTIDGIVDDIKAVTSNMSTKNYATGTHTSAASEDVLWQYDAPTESWTMGCITLDTTNQTAAETIVVRFYERQTDGGAYVKYYEITYTGVQDPLLRILEVNRDNRYGWKATLEKTAGSARDYVFTSQYQA